jgi:hypothetical protein
MRRKMLENHTCFFYYMLNYKIINNLESDTLDKNSINSINCTDKMDKENNLKFHHHVIID